MWNQSSKNSVSVWNNRTKYGRIRENNETDGCWVDVVFVSSPFVPHLSWDFLLSISASCPCVVRAPCLHIHNKEQIKFTRQNEIILPSHHHCSFCETNTSKNNEPFDLHGDRRGNAVFYAFMFCKINFHTLRKLRDASKMPTKDVQRQNFHLVGLKQSCGKN